MCTPSILSKPVKLREGYTGLFKVGGKFLVIEIISDDLKEVVFRYPLIQNSPAVTVPKSSVCIPLADLRKEYSLAL